MAVTKQLRRKGCAERSKNIKNRIETAMQSTPLLLMVKLHLSAKQEFLNVHGLQASKGRVNNIVSRKIKGNLVPKRDKQTV